MDTPKVWFITGASSGFGKSMTELVLSKGDIAVATLRKPEVLDALAARYPKDRLLVLKVDVTKHADVDHAFSQTKEAFGRVDVVFNNAGYGMFGEVEATQIDDARALFEVNFWGAVNVSRAAVKFFREVNEFGKGGVLLQNSSVAGLVGAPGLSFYSATKHALEGFSEALANEVLPAWNIRVCIIEPGGFHTNATSVATVYPEHPAYSDKSSAIAASRASLVGATFEGDPHKLTKALYSVVAGDKIPLHLPMGQDALAMLKEKVEKLGALIPDAEIWSTDLKRDDAGFSRCGDIDRLGSP
ncbi:NAD(P)-binding protein [Gyrodon lividus]|nr:NAD(P)-binding protein [Gyrodon lividus]